MAASATRLPNMNAAIGTRRAMSSQALLEACTGVRYEAVVKTLFVDSKVGDFVTFLATATGFGNVIYKKGKVTVKMVYGGSMWRTV